MPASLAVEQGGADRGLGPGCLAGVGALPLADGACPAILPHPHKVSPPAVPLLGVLWASMSEVSRGLRPAGCFLSVDLCACSPGNKESVALTEAGRLLPAPPPLSPAQVVGKWGSELENDWVHYFCSLAVLWRITISDIINMFLRFFWTPLQMVFRNSKMRCLIAKVKNIWGMEEDLEEK